MPHRGAPEVEFLLDFGTQPFAWFVRSYVCIKLSSVPFTTCKGKKFRKTSERMKREQSTIMVVALCSPLSGQRTKYAAVLTAG